MDVLLVEPSYNNKYPPMGLMKISRYHKNKGDYVYFYKGKYNSVKKWDRIYITTLFTFDYDITIETIDFYKAKVHNLDDIYVGGIAASILYNRFKEDTRLKNILTGILSNSSIIGYQDDVNIDQLDLDYDILDDTSYVYKAGDNFYGYTTRGCVNNCSFCAVPKIEGKLDYSNDIYNQVTRIRERYGDKKNLLLLDNNVLALDEEKLSIIVNDLNRLGYTHEKTYSKDNPFVKLINEYYRKTKTNTNVSNTILKIQVHLANLLQRKNISKKSRDALSRILEEVYEYDDFSMGIEKYISELKEISEKYYNKTKYHRYVDFNQGMDARLLTESKMMIIASLPIKPFRLAFDNLNIKDQYVNAVKLASNFGVNYFSNYVLYNYTDHPDELYYRLRINVELAQELGVSIYSFPMLYASVDDTTRGKIGDKWNYHYYKIIRSILNVTKGVVAKEIDFFERAFGKNIEEYREIMTMPRDFVVYRNYFEEIGLTSLWRQNYYNILKKNKVDKLLSLLSEGVFLSDDVDIAKILIYYRIKYRRLKREFSNADITVDKVFDLYLDDQLSIDFNLKKTGTI